MIAVGLDAIVGEEGIGCGVVHRCPLELEPDQLGADRGGAFLHALHEGTVDGITRVDRELEAGIRGRPADQLLKVAQRRHEVRERGGVHRGDAFAVFEERGPHRFGPVE